jgi:biotin-dependent carboxylase-like uncharacterized protein
VVYDGPDLAEVAELTGLTVAEVITRHQAAEYRVGWLGFSPGFAYLTGLDPLLATVPRLASPRLAVPAGSVAIAGGLAAVYPAASPGGWRLLGRTEAVLWDPGRDPPAALAPGTRVRFRASIALARAHPASTVPADTVPADPVPGDTAVAGGVRMIQVLQAGPLTTVQDLGRPGYAHLGVPRSGAADQASLRLANRLAGNAEGDAGLEVTLGRLALRFDFDAVVAVTGAEVAVLVGGARPAAERPSRTAFGVPANFTVPGSFRVPAGSVLRLGPAASGLRSYVAVGGGIEVPPVLGSRSADLLSGIGPQPLRPGDWLSAGRPRSRYENQRGARPRAASRPLPEPSAEVALRVIAGPRDDWFAPDALIEGVYQVSPASNRTGLRLAGPPLRRARAGELASEGVATGSLQVTHDGQLILLLADHPATGGYPVIAVVATADIGLAAQLRPGQRVRFSY